MLENPLPRDTLIDAFITQHLGNPPFTRRVLAADASFRSYHRITCGEQNFVLMDAPPPHEDVRPFCLMTHWLRGCGLHAPELLAEDAEQGLLLLEDFGDASFKKHIESYASFPRKRESSSTYQLDPRFRGDDVKIKIEWTIYKAAIDVLLHLRNASTQPAIASYDRATYLRELSVFTDWYLPEIGKIALKDSFLSLWDELLNATTLQSETVVLRDYHAENLMWLAQHDDLQCVGLLDYQDALLGDSAYDMVSLLEDARRDVSEEVVSNALGYYLEQSGESEAEFMARYHLLGAQRNLKIIGIFHRLHRRDGKANYLELLPRVWAHLQRDMSHPSLSALKAWLEQLD